MLDPARVLVVDDEPAIRALVAKIVDRAGLPVDTARDGSEAINMLEAQQYDVVVVDLMMPVLDGFGVVDYVSKMNRRPAVIVVSAGDTAMLRQLNGTVVHSIVRKPFEIDVLGDLIAAAARSLREEARREEAASEKKIVEFPRTQR